MTHSNGTDDDRVPDRIDQPPSDDGLSRRDALRAGAATGIGIAFGSATAAAADDVNVTGCEPSDGGSSPPPGPDVLHETPVTAPQFESDDEWAAEPLMVCGAEAYDDGEFLYQDWVYDDYGANTDEFDRDPQPATDQSIATPVGDIVYPTDDARYRDNAADLLEFRCRRTSGGIAYRVTLNTLVDDAPGAPIVAIGIDDGSGNTRTDWGHGLGELGAPVTHVLVLAKDAAVLDGPEESIAPSVTIDTVHNQFEATVDLDPGGSSWTHFCVTGIHDGNGGFAAVQEEADESNPGGARDENPPPVFNVAFRDEPIGDVHHWREKAQADALAGRDISSFAAEIDFARLERGAVNRDQADPTKLTGYINRVFSSRISIDGRSAYAADEEGVEDDVEDFVLTGHVQPYSVYVPDRYDPGNPGPLHVLPHSLTQNYNQYAGNPNMLRQLGEQRGAIILMFEGRGPAGWWHDQAEFDLFEAWADFRARYEYDTDRVTIGGYSMGGYGTYRLGSLYPDLFAAGFEIVGPPDEDILGGPTDERRESEHNTLDVTDNMRHVPLMMWHGTNDELVPFPGPLNYAQDLRGHGYRHEYDVFPGFDHFMFSILDQWGPGREFLEGRTVTDNPAHITYRSKPVMGHEVEDSGFTLTYDSVYWLSDITVAAPDSDDGGLVDAISYGNGYEPPVVERFNEPGTQPSAHIKRGVRWKEPTAPPRFANRLDLHLEGVTALTVWVDEAGLRLDRPLRLNAETDVDVSLTVTDGETERVVTVPSGEHELTITPCRNASAVSAS